MSTDDASPAEHLAWLQARDRATLGPGGLAELASTTWLNEVPRLIDGVPGLWRDVDGEVVGTDLAPLDSELPAAVSPDAAVRLAPGDTAEVDGTRVAAFARDGAVALRTYQDERGGRVGITGIARYPYDPALIVEATAEWAPTAPTPTEAMDGHRSTTVYDVTLTFSLAGQRLTLAAHEQGGTLFAAFSDAARPDRFRMIRIPCETGQPTVTVDFNKAYLTPSTFSPHYVCVRPPAQNRWAVPVLAGERRLLRR